LPPRRRPSSRRSRSFRGALKARSLSIDKRRHVQLLLHIAVERVRRTCDAVDFRGHGIECAAGRVLAFDNGKGFQNCTRVDSFQAWLRRSISAAVSFRRSVA
jgi:hypothetical protein